jgi:Fur family ferric uptake transcriptional regulator
MPKTQSIEELFLRSALNRAGLKATGQRRAVLRLIQLHKSISYADLARYAQQESDVEKTTTYRILRAFRASGITEEAAVNGKIHVMAAPLAANRRQRLICRSCGRTQTFRNARINHHTNRYATRRGYQLATHTLTISGYCRQCLKIGPV